MTPAHFPFAEDDPRRGRVEALVIQKLAASGVSAVASEQVRPILEQVDERSGEIVDPATGRLDEARDETYRADLERTIRAELACTGFISLGLLQVTAWYDGQSAVWDGHHARVNSTGRIATRMALSVLAGAYISETGWVPALSLAVHVQDLRSRDVAFRTAGVEPLMSFSHSRKQDLLPEDRWLVDTAALERAVDSALGDDLVGLKTEGLPAVPTNVADFRWE